jgi:hypothetical protein
LFDGSDRFDRWRFLQELLEGDAEPDIVNQLIYHVLDGALQYPRPNGDTGDVTQLPKEFKERIERILSESLPSKRIVVVVDDFEKEENTESSKTTAIMLQRIEELLPTMDDDEDAVKSMWDTVLAIHGSESVKYNETKNPTLEWKVISTVARLLIHYDFLTLGVVKAPLI